ncbi:MAG: ABC transporter ATP-binding protein [Anaerolineaceae bacterium]|nr:ABC transporter ATP-binding protein [Anaerolineaceae bacterium]
MKLPLKQYWDLLSRHIRPQRGRFALLTILLLGSIGLQVINPQVMRNFIDSALGGAAVGVLLPVALAFIGIAILQQVVSVAVVYTGQNVAWTATNALREELAEHCLNLDMSFHNNSTPGELIERIDGDITEMSNFFSQFAVTLLGNALLLVGILIALALENWQTGLAFTVFAVVTLLVLYRIRDIAVAHQKDRRQAEADLFGFVEEQLTGAEDIRSSGAVSFSLCELFRFQGNILRHNRKAQQKQWISGTIMGVLLTLGYMMALGGGYWLYTGGIITIGTVYLFVHYVNMLEAPIWALTHEVQSFQTIGACVERLIELRARQPKVTGGSREALPDGPLGLTFDDVSFSYNDQDVVLKNLTFKLEPGKVLGLLGRTGSGKTTLARLVFRLYDPTAGHIWLDGSEMCETKLETLRSRVAIVTQDVQLFRASVRDNLTFFDRAIPDERILEVVHELGLDDWYASLPKGLDSELETGGHSLSAGEAQLLAFTRVFLRDPALIILDEASSRLDPLTEQRIERAIDRLLKGRTAIIIAHRLHTVHRADHVMILSEGQMEEYGPREELAASPHSRFYQLLQTGLEEVLV